MFVSLASGLAQFPLISNCTTRQRVAEVDVLPGYHESELEADRRHRQDMFNDYAVRAHHPLREIVTLVSPTHVTVPVSASYQIARTATYRII